MLLAHLEKVDLLNINEESIFFKKYFLIVCSVFKLLFIIIFTSSLRSFLGVEFRHSTGNASENSAESGDRSFLTLGSLCLL